MNIDKQSIQKILSSLTFYVNKYGLFLFIILSLGFASYMILTIQTLLIAEPSESMVMEKSKLNQATKIDESAVKKIKELKSANIEVKSLFESSRDNPFQE